MVASCGLLRAIANDALARKCAALLSGTCVKDAACLRGAACLPVDLPSSEEVTGDELQYPAPAEKSGHLQVPASFAQRPGELLRSPRQALALSCEVKELQLSEPSAEVLDPVIPPSPTRSLWASRGPPTSAPLPPPEGGTPPDAPAIADAGADAGQPEPPVGESAAVGHEEGEEGALAGTWGACAAAEDAEEEGAQTPRQLKSPLKSPRCVRFADIPEVSEFDIDLPFDFNPPVTPPRQPRAAGPQAQQPQILWHLLPGDH